MVLLMENAVLIKLHLKAFVFLTIYSLNSVLLRDCLVVSVSITSIVTRDFVAKMECANHAEIKMKCVQNVEIKISSD